MSAKITASRKAAFLKALAATGNVSLSAERAKVSRSWVGLQRSGDPAFDSACMAAIAEAKQSFDRLRMSGEGRGKPPSGWGHLDGVELVVRGSGGAALRDAAGAAPQDERKKGRHIQIARARVKQWSPRVEDRFLATLAATCNVKAACAEAGMSAASAYRHRAQWRSFAGRWDAAIDEGYTRIEIALIENAGNLFSSAGFPADAPIPPMTAAQAIHILHMHKYAAKGIGKRPGLRPRPPTLDDVRDGILRKLSAFAAASELSEAERAAFDAACALRRGSERAGE